MVQFFDSSAFLGTRNLQQRQGITTHFEARGGHTLHTTDTTAIATPPTSAVIDQTLRSRKQRKHAERITPSKWLGAPGAAGMLFTIFGAHGQALNQFETKMYIGATYDLWTICSFNPGCKFLASFFPPQE